jgi:hypothetical protein
MINLGLLLKPMYQDSEYLNKLNDIEEIEVSYVFNGENQLKIKKSIDNWLRTQPINLDNQERIKILLKEEFDSLTKNYNILKKSETYDKLFNEVMEMLTMRLTVISLTDSFSEESFEPISIR